MEERLEALAEADLGNRKLDEANRARWKGLLTQLQVGSGLVELLNEDEVDVIGIDVSGSE